MLKHIFKVIVSKQREIKCIRSLYTSKSFLSHNKSGNSNDLFCSDTTNIICKEKPIKLNICPPIAKKVYPPCETVVCKTDEKSKVKKDSKPEQKDKKKDETKEKVDSNKKEKPKEEKPIQKDFYIDPVLSSFGDCKVVIIGAGYAGLAAGKYLEENGIKNFVILEAQGRPGGRIHSEWFSDSIVELGAPCHKSTSEPSSFLQAAIADGFIKPPFAHMSIFNACDGRSISPTISLIAYEIYKRIYCESTRLETNVLEFINFRIEQEVSSFPVNVRQDVTRVMLGVLAMQCKKEGDNLRQFIHRHNHVNYLQSPGGKLRVPIGHYSIIQPLLDAIPQENVKYCKPVQSIRWGAVVCKDTPRALVKCSDGSVYPADYVIITVSLGVLKERHSTLFCPALPAETVEAIDCMGYIHKNKLYIEFSKPFWCWSPETIDINFSPEDMNEFTDWKKGLRCIQQLHGSNNVLCVSVEGDEAIALEKLCETKIMEGVKEMIRCNIKIKKFPPFKCTLKSYWSSNIYFNGAYSYIPLGVQDGIQQVLASPLPGNNAPVSPILFFAGEATCPKLSGTVKAAKISGIREAARIKKIITSSSTQMSEQKLAVAL